MLSNFTREWRAHKTKKLTIFYGQKLASDFNRDFPVNELVGTSYFVKSSFNSQNVKSILL